MTALLSRQDEVIAELDALDLQILEVIAEVNAQRTPPETIDFATFEAKSSDAATDASGSQFSSERGAAPKAA